MDKLENFIGIADWPGNVSHDDAVEILVELITRLKKTEAALDRLYPGWSEDACLPNCQGACCEI